MDDYESAINSLFRNLQMLKEPGQALDDFDLSEQMRLARENEAPPSYDASGSHNSFVTKITFVNLFAIEERTKQIMIPGSSS